MHDKRRLTAANGEHQLQEGCGPFLSPPITPQFSISAIIASAGLTIGDAFDRRPPKGLGGAEVRLRADQKLKCVARITLQLHLVCSQDNL